MIDQRVAVRIFAGDMIEQTTDGEFKLLRHCSSSLLAKIISDKKG